MVGKKFYLSERKRRLKERWEIIKKKRIKERKIIYLLLIANPRMMLVLNHPNQNESPEEGKRTSKAVGKVPSKRKLSELFQRKV